MMKKRVDEKLHYYRERLKNLPDTEARLEELKAKRDKVQRHIQKEVDKQQQARAKKKRKATTTDEVVTTMMTGNEKLAARRRKLRALKEEIQQLEKDVEAIKDGKELHNYLLDASQFILEFENEKNVEERAMVEMKKVAPTVSKLGSFLDNLPTATSSETTSTKHGTGESAADVNLFSVLQPNLGISSVQSTPSTRQKEVYADYLCFVEHDDSKRRKLIEEEGERTRDVCSQPECRGQLYEDKQNDHMMICLECGCAETKLPETDVGTYNDPIIPIQAAFAYKKKNHFRDWLAKSQGKENTTIPQVVYDSLLNELRKMRITQAEDVTRQIIRELLMKLKMPKYYHNISQIHYHITGKRPPQFTHEEETILMEMFMQLEPVYEEVKPDNRANFFSYEYCLNKFCQIQYEMTKDTAWRRNLKYFKLLKGRQKLYETDQRWKACCQKLNWPFIKSI